MVQLSRPRLTPTAPLWGGAAAAGVIALTALLLPAALLENIVESSGIAALLPVAAPPLGATARAVLALGGGVGVGAVVWAAMYLLIGPGGPLASAPRTSDAPLVRRADTHPDAPPRWPLSVRDLPPLAMPGEQTVPGDLDLPLASFDPDALPPVPLAPVRALKPLAPAPALPLAPGERLETFVLTPPPPPAPRSEEPPSIDALLRRLEQSARRRTATAH